MRRILISTAAALGLLFAGGAPSPQASAGAPAVSVDDDASLEALLAADCVDDTAIEIAQAASRLPQEGGVASDEWPPRAIGGLIPPVRSVSDPFPTFDGIALDTENNRVIFSDENRHSLLVYDRTAGGSSNEPTEPVQWVFGPKTRLGYIAGVEVDPIRKEFYTVNNDSGDLMTVFSYEDHGNVQPRRTLTLPHQSWGVSLAPKRDEIVISVQQSNALSFYKRGATGTAPPLRTIRGLATEIEDPHGTYFDEAHNEIITANHGNWTQIRPYSPYDPQTTDVGEYKSGAFHPSAITFHAADAHGDVPPLRTIEGNLTGLNWPMGIDVDLTHDEIAVANYGDSSVRIFRRGDKGNVQPVRVLRGALTQIVGPVSVAIDTRNDELWVANYGDHTAVVFPRTASGNVRPKRTIRNAPKDTPTCGFTNASAAAYDSKRDEILVPN
jgi:6-phosphogluconolactonase (cycloisomerase 2 family)